MAISKCPNPDCKSTNGFEAKPDTVGGYPYPVMLIQCKKCGTVIGTQLFPGIIEDIKTILEELP